MKTNIKELFENAIKESIFTLNDTKTIVEFYGEKTECTIENYFGAQINSGILYNSTDEFSIETQIGLISDFEMEFEDARETVFNNWLTEKCQSIDISVLIDVENEVLLTENGPEFYGVSADMNDSSMSTLGDSLFIRIFNLMGECPFGQDVNVAAILAGAKYCYVTNDDDYELYFWKNKQKRRVIRKIHYRQKKILII